VGTRVCAHPYRIVCDVQKSRTAGMDSIFAYRQLVVLDKNGRQALVVYGGYGNTMHQYPFQF
jgi:predicted proteasome-type protease